MNYSIKACKYVEVEVRTDISLWYDSRIFGQNTEEVDEKGLTRKMAQDLGLDFTPASKEPAQLRWCKILIDLSTVFVPRQLTDKEFGIVFYGGGTYRVRGSYEDFRDVFLRYKAKSTAEGVYVMPDSSARVTNPDTDTRDEEYIS